MHYDFRVLFVQKFKSIRRLSLQNHGPRLHRQKDFDEIEIKNIISAFPSLTALALDCRCIKLATLKQFIKHFP